MSFIIGSDNGLAPNRRQAIIWTNDGLVYWRIGVARPQWVNTLRPRQNGRRFADHTFKRILVNENVIISTKISLKFVPMGLINNIPSLVQIVAWRRPGDKPLSELMMVTLLTHMIYASLGLNELNRPLVWTHICFAVEQAFGDDVLHVSWVILLWHIIAC